MENNNYIRCQQCGQQVSSVNFLFAGGICAVCDQHNYQQHLIQNISQGYQDPYRGTPVDLCDLQATSPLSPEDRKRQVQTYESEVDPLLD